MADDYLNKLNELRGEKIDNSKGTRKISEKNRYKKDYKISKTADVQGLAVMALHYLHKKPGTNPSGYSDIDKYDLKGVTISDRWRLAGIANKLMNHKKNGEYAPELAIKGALIYEKLGKGNRDSVKRKLMRGLNDIKDISHLNKNEKERIFNDAEKFFERNSSDKSGGLENKTLGIFAGISFLASLFFLSGNLTGNVIGNLTTNFSSFLGIGLFILAVLLAYFCFKK